ncbi:MAG: radical SAM family heme chaperone HemW [bacterium]|nr:radical SAM family heme chaperone HemW [bacterium]
MAGIYLHIPFCKQACYYCDFHFSTNQSSVDEMVSTMIQELDLRKDYLEGENIETIYFGGGTPSILEGKHIRRLLEKIESQFKISDSPEITLEANPDDLSRSKLAELYNYGINRLSIGIQSFNESHLKYLNRAHTNKEAINCVENAIEIGFDNITIDLIYGIPFENEDPWPNDIATALDLGVDHISAYCLTIEPQTVFGKWLNQNKIKPINEELAASHFNYLLEKLNSNGFEQYEISNFCKSGCYSKHNTSYWQQKRYLGIGPSAHSFNKVSRQFNIANNAKYIKALNSGAIPCEVEILSNTQKVNEMMMTGLRTKWGVSLDEIREVIPGWETKNSSILKDYTQNQYLKLSNNHLIITEKGKLLADEIALNLFLDE